jgi:uncharacterized protein YbjT (DUF2867 family)
MRILVVGGTGRTGRRIVQAALQEGHETLVLGRSAAAENVPLGAVPVAVDVLDGAALDSAMAGVDVVVTALSIPRQSRSPFATPTGPPDLHQRSTRALLEAMERHGVSRLVKVSAQGVGDSAPRAGWGFRLLVAMSHLRGAFADHAVADELVRASAVKFTIVRPPILVDGPPTRPLRAGEALSTWSWTRVSTGDVAAFVVAILDDPAYFGRCVTLSP